ncbi:MAG: HTH domain-containing protein, partial [Erysipelothrix sp.]|nr:HTH domain-containing protein [Erysipelothrix sp.]
MKHKRLFDIVKYLTKQDDYTSIDAIASFLSVSNRTIRNDLDLLETQLKSTPIKLIRTPGMGIKLSGSHKDTLELVNHLNKQTPIAAIQSANQRRSAMILRLLSNKNTKISELMHEFYVSRATVQKDLV